MSRVLFVSDLHGKMSRYDSLLKQIEEEKPELVLLGGDLLPHLSFRSPGKLDAETFAAEYLPGKFGGLKDRMGADYPPVLLILGNDDPRMFEELFLAQEDRGLWHYLHMRTFRHKNLTVAGYAMVPPTPFQLKDWERYDVSRFTDPGCIPPDEGRRTVNPGVDPEYTFISQELAQLSEGLDMERTLFLFHSPPYGCLLDRAALDGVKVDHVPVDVHVGSIAIRRFIEEKQPLATLHGHVHESTRLTGSWKEQFGRTWSFNAAHDGPELSVIRFSTSEPAFADRQIL